MTADKLFIKMAILDHLERLETIDEQISLCKELAKDLERQRDFDVAEAINGNYEEGD